MHLARGIRREETLRIPTLGREYIYGTEQACDYGDRSWRQRSRAWSQAEFQRGSRRLEGCEPERDGAKTELRRGVPLTSPPLWNAASRRINLTWREGSWKGRESKAAALIARGLAGYFR